MNRRAFVTGLGVVLAARRSSEAQQAPRIYDIGAILQGGPYYATIDRPWRQRESQQQQRHERRRSSLHAGLSTHVRGGLGVHFRR